MLNWYELTPGDFELLVLRLIESMGYEGAVKVAGPGDRGHDVVAFHPEKLPGVEPRTRKIVFQCKRVRQITKGEIQSELANFLSERLDNWILVAPISPSPELRAWLAGLDGAPQYRFHIQAWWLDEIERYVRQHEDELRRYVPELVVKLGLTNAHSPVIEDSLNAILGRSRHLVQMQIRRFARGKYIPDLYVRRSLEDELDRFLQTEPEAAESLKERLIAGADSLYRQVVRYPTEFREVDERLRRTLERKHDIRPDERDRLLAQVELRERVSTASENWYRALPEMLENLVRVIRTLSTRRHLGFQVEHEAVQQAADRCLRHLQEIPGVSSSSSTDSTYLSFPDAPPIKSAIEDLMSELARYRRLGLLVVDRAGGGKTNLICHLSAENAERQPTLLLFGKQQLSGPESLVHDVIASIQQLVPNGMPAAVDYLDSILDVHGLFLTIFVDGINENRRLGELDESILHLLDWAASHRMKIVLTCRDIYANFFRISDWEPLLRTVVRERLNQFSTDEYREATELYLRHYSITCTLRDEAERACRHPLLLRFFCEAYGQIEGTLVNLGEIRDIRLKELFSIYLSRKFEQIREALNHRDARLIQRFVQEIALKMFESSAGVLPLEEVETATGERDTSTHESIYVRLLDEDIVLEEHPGGSLEEKRVSFVYEEFMEFLLARALLTRRVNGKRMSPVELFEVLAISNRTWVNARGVAEYVGLMLIEGEHDYTRLNAETFLSCLATSDDVWRSAFWSVIGKCPEQRLGSDIFDLFPLALPGLKSRKAIQSLLGASSRLSESSAALIAATILWSTLLPNVFTWRHLEALPTMREEEVQQLSELLCSKLPESERYSPPTPGFIAAMFESIQPFLTKSVAQKIKSIARSHGRPGHTPEPEQATAQTIRVIWNAFPALQPKLLNGIFSSAHSVRVVCADRLRFVDSAKPQIQALCRPLAVCEGATEVGDLLRRV